MGAIDFDRIRKSKKLFIATPFGRDPALAYMFSILETTTAFGINGIPSHYCGFRGGADLAYNRNAIAALFLASDCTDLLWIDSDMGWTPEAAMTLFANDKDFICTTCRKKEAAEKLVIGPSEYCGAPDVDGLIPVTMSGLGFVKTSRRVFERIMREKPELRRLGGSAGDGLDLWRFFMFSGDGIGEDLRFSGLWRSLGETVWLDPTIALSHVGVFDFRRDGKI
jgi:hypothetical protein